MERERYEEDIIKRTLAPLTNGTSKCNMLQSFGKIESNFDVINDHRKRILDQMAVDGKALPNPSTVNSSTIFFKASAGKQNPSKDKSSSKREEHTAKDSKKRSKGSRKKQKLVSFKSGEYVNEHRDKENIDAQQISKVIGETEDDFLNIFDSDWL